MLFPSTDASESSQPLPSNGPEAKPLPSDLYTLLVSILNTQTLSEIAITPYPIPSPTLPNPHEPFTRFPSDSQPGTSALAVPQKALYGIYAHATQLFHLIPRGSQDMQDITRVLLLQNPEHATALNIRKEWLQSRGLAEEELEKELQFAGLVLSVPANAKASNMWFHRRWVLGKLYPTVISTPATPGRSEVRRLCELPGVDGPLVSLPQAVTEKELGLTLKGATIYRRNYFAWRHRMWLIGSYLESPYPETEIRRDYEQVKKFWESNPRDHTAAMYLAKVVFAGGALGLGIGKMGEEVARDMVGRYGIGETPWLFWRRMYALEGGDRERYCGDALRLVKERESVTVEEEGEETLAGREERETKKKAVLALRSLFWIATREGKITWLDQNLNAVLRARDQMPDISGLVELFTLEGTLPIADTK